MNAYLNEAGQFFFLFWGGGVVSLLKNSKKTALDKKQIKGCKATNKEHKDDVLAITQKKLRISN